MSGPTARPPASDRRVRCLGWPALGHGPVEFLGNVGVQGDFRNRGSRAETTGADRARKLGVESWHLGGPPEAS